MDVLTDTFSYVVFVTNYGDLPSALSHNGPW